MEKITHDLLEKKNSIKSIEEAASSIKSQIQNLQMQLKSLEERHCLNIEAGGKLESDYEVQKKQLIMVEKTIKTLQQSKERIKFMVENLSPSIELLDDSD